MFSEHFQSARHEAKGLCTLPHFIFIAVQGGKIIILFLN